jgi:hypothetical protein
MATLAKPGVDVFIYWSAFRWVNARDWCPGFFPGTNNESTHAENEPNHAAEAEPVLRLHLGSLHHSFPDGDSAFSVISQVRNPRNLIKSAGAFERLQPPVIQVSYVITNSCEVEIFLANARASDDSEKERRPSQATGFGTFMMVDPPKGQLQTGQSGLPG